MIQLIADSGSSKTDWRLVKDDGETTSFQTQGLNPYHLSDLAIMHALDEHIVPNLRQMPDEIHFYGAGCAAEENKKLMSSCLNHSFPGAGIAIETDLLGAARALLGNSGGFIGILGTGSNTGIYDGQKITKSVDSLGWILGDEGSGVHIGKEIIKLWLRGNLSSHDEKKFLRFCQLSRDEIINRIYHQSAANEFLSRFAKFASEHPSKSISSVVASSFKDLMEKVIKLYNSATFSELNFVGSVAWHFKEILTTSAQIHHYSIGKIVQSPIEELVKYHSVK